MTNYAARQIYNELFVAGFSTRELEFYTLWHDTPAVRLNPLDRRLVVVISQEGGVIHMRYWHDLDELHEGVPPFHVDYAPDYMVMLVMLR